MHFQYVPYIWPLLASALVTLGLAVYALCHRNVRGALPFGLCMLLAFLWAGSYALEKAGADLTTMLFWLKLPFISYAICPVLWLIMVFLFIERERWVNWRNILLLLILPAITLILVWSDYPFFLVQQNIYLDTSGAFPTLGKTFGPWFWVIFGYADLINIFSMVLMGWSLRRKSLLYRRQVLVLFIGLGLVILQNAAYLCGIYPARHLDLTPVMMGVSGLIIAWGIFRFQLFDIVPVARENIIENMADGLVVLDAQNRIVDVNLTAKTIFGNTSSQPIGQDARAFFKNCPAFTAVDCETEKLPGELVIEKDSRTKIYEVSCSPLYNRQRRRNGTSLIFHDVTEQRESQARLLEQQRSLVIAEERERLARDLHDNLGQVFGFINVQAQAIKRELPSTSINGASDKLGRLIEVTQSAHQQMREYIHSAKDIAAVEKDFVAALKYEVARVKKQTGLAIGLDISDDLPLIRLKPAAWNHILSVIKEALNNIQKHAGAKNVSVVIKAAGTEFSAVIADDGRGFDMARLEKRPLEGLGLSIMKERATEMGGQLRIDTAPGKGTQVILRVPLHREAIGADDESNAGR